MAILIDAAQNWRRYEKRTFRMTVVDTSGAAVNLTGLSLEWQLLHSQRTVLPPLLHKKSGDFLAPEGTPIPNVAVWQVTDAESSSVPEGFYWMELWDRSNDVNLLAGNVVLLPGHAPIGEWIIPSSLTLMLSGKVPTVP